MCLDFSPDRDDVLVLTLFLEVLRLADWVLCVGLDHVVALATCMRHRKLSPAGQSSRRLPAPAPDAMTLAPALHCDAYCAT